MWREHQHDLSQFTLDALRGDGAGATPGAAAGAPVRLLGRLAEAGVRTEDARGAAPGVDAGPRRPRPRVPRDQAPHAHARPPHRVRGGRLPEHLRVLGRPHRHVHDPRRPVHARVRLLPGRHPQAAAPRPRRARPRRRRDRAARPRARGDHQRGPRRRRRRRRRRVRVHDHGRSSPHPPHQHRGAHPRLQG